MYRSSVAAVLAACAFAICASAQPYPDQMRPKAAKNFVCPAQVSVKMIPALPVGGGWQANTGAFNVQLDPANPPHLSGGNMTCYYKLGNQPGAFMLYQPVGTMHCSPTSNGAGFVCTM